MASTWREARDELVAAVELRPVQRGFIGMCLIVAGALTPAFLPPGNPLRLMPLSIMQTPAGRAVGTLVFLAGIALVVDAWLQLRPATHGAARGWAVLTAWCAPLVFAPPILSHDAFSYAAQGQLVHDRVTPYRHGPVDGNPDFAAQVDPVWLYTPAPYGPVALQVNHLITDLTGHSPWFSAVLMRLPALVSVALIAVLVPKIARHFGRNPDKAQWLTVLNPLTVLHLVGGAHNDAMMIAAMVVAAWLATRGGFASSAAAVALAMSFKQTAIIILPAVTVLALTRHFVPRWTADGRRATAGYISLMLGAFAVACVVVWTVFAALTGWTQLGYGWLKTIQVPTRITSMSLPSILGQLGALVLRAAGYPDLAAQSLPTARSIGMLLAVAAMVWLGVRTLRRPTDDRITELLCLAPLALAFGGPALHSWYLLWGGIYLGLVRLGARGEHWVVLATIFFCGYNAVDYSVRNGLVTFGIVLVLTLAYRALIWGRWKGRDPLAERAFAHRASTSSQVSDTADA